VPPLEPGPELLADDPVPPPELLPDELLPLAAPPEPPPLLEPLLLEDVEASPAPPSSTKFAGVEPHPPVEGIRDSTARRPTVLVALMVRSSSGHLQGERASLKAKASQGATTPSRSQSIAIQADVGHRYEISGGKEGQVGLLWRVRASRKI
jgi:hypothetical protein